MPLALGVTTAGLSLAPATTSLAPAPPPPVEMSALITELGDLVLTEASDILAMEPS